MKFLNGLMLTLVIIGAVNWGLIGLFKFDLVKYLFGELTVMSRTIFTLVGIAGLWCMSFYGRVLDRYPD